MPSQSLKQEGCMHCCYLEGEGGRAGNLRRKSILEAKCAPKAPEESPAEPHWAQTADHGNGKGRYHLKPLNLWSFLMAANRELTWPFSQ